MSSNPISAPPRLLDWMRGIIRRQHCNYRTEQTATLECPPSVGSRRLTGAVVQALADAKPDAIFSSLFAADLQKFVAA